MTENLAARLVAEVSKKRKRIVVCGDAMIDHWVHGRVAECQDGCPKFVEESRVETPGGAANAVQCLQHWDVLTDLFGRGGADQPQKWRFVDADGKIVWRWDDEPPLLRTNWDPSPLRYKWNYEHALEMVGCADGVLLSDYDKGFLTPEFIQEVADLCKARGVPCVADCKRAPEVYGSVILKGNLAWAYRWTYQAEVITRGRYNPFVEGDECGIDLLQVSLVNHVGAGDCFAAHLTLALAYGFSLKDAAAVAHSAGRVYVQFAHNRAPLPQEVVVDMQPAVGGSGR